MTKWHNHFWLLRQKFYPGCGEFLRGGAFESLRDLSSCALKRREKNEIIGSWRTSMAAADITDEIFLKPLHLRPSQPD